MWFNVEQICEDADCREYAAKRGIKIVSRGSTSFIKCPDHKADTSNSHFSNCQLSKNGYYCYSCGSKGNIISLAMNELSMDFQEACIDIIDYLGNDYSVYTSEQNMSEKKKSNDCAFSYEELELLGLKIKVNVLLPQNFSLKTEGKYDILMDDNIYYCHVNEQSFDIMDFYKEDKQTFYSMIFFKIKEQIEHVIELHSSDYIEKMFLEKRKRKNFEETLFSLLKEYEKMIQKYSGFAEFKIPMPEYRYKNRFSSKFVL